jgi:hypothetical protein
MTKILIGSGNETTILRSQHDLDEARDLLGVTHQRINYETGRLLAEPKALGIGSVVNLGAEFMQGGTAHSLIGGVCAPSQRERRCCSGGSGDVYAGERDGDRPTPPANIKNIIVAAAQRRHRPGAGVSGVAAREQLQSDSRRLGQQAGQ